MPSITEEEHRLPKSPEDRPISGEGCCELCLYNIPRGSMMVILPGIILLLCGGLTLLVADSSSGSGSWTAVTSLSILIVGAIITTLGFLYCTKMWCKYKPRTKKKPANSGEEPVSLVAVYKIRQEGQVNPGFVPDGQGRGVNGTRGHSGHPGVVTKQPGREKEDISRDYSKSAADDTDSVDKGSSSDIDVEKGYPLEDTEDTKFTAQSQQQTPDVAPSADDRGDAGADGSKFESPPDSSTLAIDKPKESETSFNQDEIIFRDERIMSPQTDTSEVL